MLNRKQLSKLRNAARNGSLLCRAHGSNEWKKSTYDAGVFKSSYKYIALSQVSENVFRGVFSYGAHFDFCLGEENV